MLSCVERLLLTAALTLYVNFHRSHTFERRKTDREEFSRLWQSRKNKHQVQAVGSGLAGWLEGRKAAFTLPKMPFSSQQHSHVKLSTANHHHHHHQHHQHHHQPSSPPTAQHSTKVKFNLKGRQSLVLKKQPHYYHHHHCCHHYGPHTRRAKCCYFIFYYLTEAFTFFGAFAICPTELLLLSQWVKRAFYRNPISRSRSRSLLTYFTQHVCAQFSLTHFNCPKKANGLKFTATLLFEVF